jgi:hypothetical protein
MEKGNTKWGGGEFNRGHNLGFAGEKKKEKQRGLYVMSKGT